MTDNNHIAVFGKAYKLYKKYGAVRTKATEFKEFKDRHKDWHEVLPLLLPAIEYQAAWRARHTGWVAEWQNFKTWLGKQRTWERRYPEQTYSEPDEKMAERWKKKLRYYHASWISDPNRTQAELDDFVKRCPHVKWLVDEIRSTK